MIRAVALFLTVCTGFSGLVYEVAWQKYLATLLGAHSEATAAVLAIFLGGLAVGYSLFGRVTRRRMDQAGPDGPRLLRAYGAVEASIGLYAFLFPWLFTAAQRVSYLMPAHLELLGFGFDVLLTALLLLPPTILMGGTIPFLTQALARSLEDSTRIHALIYALNTAGAFAGALAGGFWLVPWLGLDGVLYAMGGVNLTAGLVFLALDLRHRMAPSVAAAPEAAPELEGVRSYYAVAFLSGFAMMCVQTVLNRVGGLSLGASHFTFAMVVAVFVLCIALGSFAVSALSRVPAWLVAGSQWLLVALLAALYQPLQDGPYYAHVVRALFRDVDAGFYPYYGAVFLGTLAVLAIPIGLSGALLPLLFHHLRRQAGDLGAVAGRIYSWNTLGSLAGALLGGYALLFWLDLHHVYRIAVGAVALSAALLSVGVLGLPRSLAALSTALVAAALVLGFRPWDPAHIAAGLFRARQPEALSFAGPTAFFANRWTHVKTIFHRDDPTTTVTVREIEEAQGRTSRALLTNGKSDGDTTGDYTTMGMAALVPALFAEKDARAFVIGWGLGITVGELGALQDTKEIVVAEISRGVIQAAPLFDFANQRASRNPKVRVVRSDAYRALLRSEGHFDVIASEPSNPWVTGVEMLYSREFLTAARDRLAPGGVYAQWFHLYETDKRSVDLVLRTYRAVFDHVAVWYTIGPDLLLLGFKSPDRIPDLATLRQRYERPDFKEGFERAKVGSFELLLAHEVLPLDVLAASPLPGRVHTLRHPLLSQYAARAFFQGKQAEMPRLATVAGAAAGARNSLLRRADDLDGSPVDEDLVARLARASCESHRAIECATFLARGLRDHPESQKLVDLAAEFRHDELMGGVLDPAALSILIQLYGGEPLKGVPPLGSLQTAQLLSENYFRFFNHAVPFDRAVLDLAWQRCREPEEIEACRTGRLKTRQLLGLGPVRTASSSPPR